MALLHRQSAITESVFNMMESCVTEFSHCGAVREPSGSGISGVVPSGTFRTSDVHFVTIGGNGNSVYTRLMAAIGRPDMGADNPLYANNSERCKREAEIMGEIESWVASRTQAEVEDAMKGARVPCGPIYSTRDICGDEQFRARGAFQNAVPPEGGHSFVLPSMAPQLSSTPGSTKWAGTSLGFHTEEVIKGELGMSDERISELREIGAI
uniref:Transferase n=1 Tax=Tetraselmis sp. GSL018 TaxID=582737 RepID=A0A061RVN6_9CHLO